MSEENYKALLELKSFKEDKDCRFWIGKNGVNAVDKVVEMIDSYENTIKELEKEVFKYKESADYLYEQYQDIGRMYFKLRELIEKELERQYELFNDPKRQKEYSQEVVDTLEDILFKEGENDEC